MDWDKEGRDILLCGLAFTSRTEATEDYLKKRASTLTVIAISSCFLKKNQSCCRVYEKGRLIKNFTLPNFRLKDYKWFRQPLVVFVFIVNWLVMLFTVLRLKKRYSLAIGISHSFALFGALLKKFRIARKLIYYCIDYYIPENKLNFNSLFVKCINVIDRLTLKNADFIWDLSPRIQEYRKKIGKYSLAPNKFVVVPLGYPGYYRRNKDLGEIERWEIGFVGSITPNQGLQLLAETMPSLVSAFPKISALIIGEGPYSEEFKNFVNRSGLDSYFRFTGFIRDEDEMLDLISCSAIAIALYSQADNSNAVCADSGKPKLYAVCSLPVISTQVCFLSSEIARSKAGLVVDYSCQGLYGAIEYLLSDIERLKEYRQNAARLGENFISDNIFEEALAKTNLYG